MWKRNPDRTVNARLPGIKCGSGGIGSPMMRSGMPSTSICPNSKSYSHSIRRAAVVSGGAFFRSAASFSQQIPKLICERSCRMAKTLTVNITPILKKESRKTKKIKKKMRFPAVFPKWREKNTKDISISPGRNEDVRIDPKPKIRKRPCDVNRS